jgi:hypothetical protein
MSLIKIYNDIYHCITDNYANIDSRCGRFIEERYKIFLIGNIFWREKIKKIVLKSKKCIFVVEIKI